MAAPEIPSLQEETGKRKLFDFTRGMMYWQGLLPDGPGLDLQYLSPSLARILVRHPRLRLALRYFRTLYPWFTMSLMCGSVVLLHPVSIYTLWDNKTDVIDNAYPMVLWFAIAIAIATLMVKKTECRNLITKLEKLSMEENLDNEYQQDLIRRMNFWGFNIIKYTHFVGDSFASVSVIIVGLAGLLPRRKLFFRSWYPYDETASPAYEITLALTCIEGVCGFFLANTFQIAFISYLMYLGVLFKILSNKFLNIRKIAVGRILDRKRRELERRAAESLHVRELLGREQQVSVHSGHPDWASRQPDRHASLSPLVEDEVGCTDEEVDKEMKLVLKEFVRFHIELVSLKNDIQSVLEYYFMMLSGLNIVIYGGALLTIILHPEFGLYEFLIVLITFEAVAAFLLVNLFCNFVTDQARSVVEALHACDWLESSPSFKSSMLIIMSRANSPLVFKPRGFDPLSLNNFAQISNIAYKVTTRMIGFLNR